MAKTEIETIIAKARGPLALDEATIALLSDPANLEAIERMEDALHGFKQLIGRQFIDRLRRALAEVAARQGGNWQVVETSRVETYIGLKPAGEMQLFAEDFWLVFAYSTSPGLPFAAPWLGLFTTPRAQTAIKRELYDSTRAAFRNPKRDSPADWWVQWDWVPDWPDTARPRNLALLAGESQARLAAAVASWMETQAPIVADILRRESGVGWNG